MHQAGFGVFAAASTDAAGVCRPVQAIHAGLPADADRPASGPADATEEHAGAERSYPGHGALSVIQHIAV